ncbi:hypothetical protein UFOVP335_19 [uncultured Caudovirales phage]|uniref:Uncharacterized protein n=1 Tax=uncultured Caudovirales phage TaxID=2100421 RepID=A0A6J5LZL8_9CAUD|nr:hypothetical protein UFOVP335_19 [uncultured Caudovirales phage]
MGFNLDDYEPVASRISKFYEAHPDGRIITELVHYLPDVAVFKAEIWIGDLLVSTGWEEEVRNSSHINKTSHLANAETGAVGRGLANYNLAGSDPTKRPSREEMGKAQRYSAPKPRIAQAPSAMADANGVSVKGNQYGDLPDWLVLEAFQAGVSQVWDNRDKVAGTKRPWFKDVNGDKAFWPPRGTPDPVIALHEDDLADNLAPEEPF